MQLIIYVGDTGDEQPIKIVCSLSSKGDDSVHVFSDSSRPRKGISIWMRQRESCFSPPQVVKCGYGVHRSTQGRFLKI